MSERYIAEDHSDYALYDGEEPRAWWEVPVMLTLAPLYLVVGIAAALVFTGALVVGIIRAGLKQI